ncbi:MAG: ABC transporter ATP-binding protein [Verrucomicrobiota bacterium]
MKDSIATPPAPPDREAFLSGGPAVQEAELVVDTDIAFNGQSERQWLVSTAETLRVLREENHETLRSFEWKEIESVRTVAGVGCGLLQVRIGGEWRDLLRFSNALSERFHKVSRRLGIRFDKQDADEDDDRKADIQTELLALEEEPLDPPKCPSCRIRLPKNQESCPRCLQKGQILSRVWEILQPHWKGGLAVGLLTLLGIAADLVPPKLQQFMVDGILNNRTVAEVEAKQLLAVVVLALAFSRIMLAAVGIIKGRLASLIGSGITCNLRKQMVDKLQKMAVSYYDRHEVGSLISRVAHDSEVLHGLMNQLTGGFLLQIGQLVGVGTMLFVINAKLALFTMIPVPFVLLGSWFFWKKVYPRYYRLWDASSKQMTALSGMLSGIRVVKAFAQEDKENKRFQNAADHLRDWRVWVEYANARYSAVMQIIFSLGGLIVWYVGGLDVIAGDMTLGALMAFLAYNAMFYGPLGALSNFTSWLTSFLSGSKRVMELMDTPISIMEPKDPTPWPDPKGEIVFDHVTFGYDQNTPVLKDISFKVAPGEMVGIVGRSGSGKTTMVNLLGRFYDPQEGTVRIDGVDVKNLSLQELRHHLGVVFQDSFLFRGTIWKNLSYGRAGTTIEEGLAKAKASGAHDFICNKGLAYETQLGERGSGLSGGEKQRLSIARTLLYDPRILVLDEATSNIDAEAEKSIQEALEVLIKDRSTVALLTGYRPCATPTGFWSLIAAGSSSKEATPSC